MMTFHRFITPLALEGAQLAGTYGLVADEEQASLLSDALLSRRASAAPITCPGRFIARQAPILV